MGGNRAKAQCRHVEPFGVLRCELRDQSVRDSSKSATDSRNWFTRFARKFHIAYAHNSSF